MSFLLDLERSRIEEQINNGRLVGRFYLGLRFYSNKLVMDTKKEYPEKTIREILIELARKDEESI